MLKVPANEAVKRLNDRINLAQGLMENEEGKLSDKFNRWDAYNFELIQCMFTGEQLIIEYNTPLREPTADRVLGVLSKLTVIKWFLERIQVLKSIVDRVELFHPAKKIKSTNTTATANKQTNSKKVFIVHGQDELAKVKVARFIEKLGFEPIILHEQSNGGKTIIEKIEANSDVGFAVVLLTPCDVGAKKGEELNPRARQNVILELGYFMGLLGRSKVCALVKGDLEKPNDISGVVYTLMDDNDRWHVDLAKELKAVGYNVDMNKIF